MPDASIDEDPGRSPGLSQGPLPLLRELQANCCLPLQCLSRNQQSSSHQTIPAHLRVNDVPGPCKSKTSDPTFRLESPGYTVKTL